jgi:Ran GTPase-activating protein 1
MCNDGLSAEASVLVASILLDNGCPPLTELHFYNNMSGSDGAVAVRDIVKSCPHLESFRFSATRPGPAGCLAIAEVENIAFIVSLEITPGNR